MIKLSFDLFNNEYLLYERLIVLLASFIPSLFLVGITLYSDRKSREPNKNIIICLISGIFTISLARFFEQLVAPYIASEATLTYVWAILEELSKILIFYLFIFDNKYYDDIYDGPVYMAIIALSFAAVENLMYAFSESTIDKSVSLALMRDLTTIPLHVICGVVIGYFLSLANFSKTKKNKFYNIFFAIFIAGIIHGTYNTFMGYLARIDVDYTNTIMVLSLVVIPLVVIICALFYVALRFIKKTVKLNGIYIRNEKYSGKYSYLMNQEEYIISNFHIKRIAAYDKLNSRIRRNKVK